MHSLPKSQQETLDGHSLSINLRTCLFPHCRSRAMKTSPAPKPFFDALVSSFTDVLRRNQWRLPALGECQHCFGSMRKSALDMSRPYFELSESEIRQTHLSEIGNMIPDGQKRGIQWCSSNMFCLSDIKSLWGPTES